jgi:flagellar hook-associated protein FlgK
MSDILGIASGGVMAYQRALSSVSNNIANVGTDGYTRQTSELTANLPAKVGASYLGTGVMFTAVKRAYDEFADSNLRKSTSDLMGQEPMVTYTQRIIDIMGDKSVGLNSALDTFFGAAINLSTDPASTVQRTAFLRATDGLTSRFAELSGQLDLVADEATQAMQSNLGQFNSLAGQLALLNGQLNREADVKNQPAELLDRRDLLLRQMAEFAPLKVKTQPNGGVVVSVGTGTSQSVVVEKTTARPIGIDTTNGKLNFVLDPYGDATAMEDISTGKLGGLTRVMKQVLGPAHDNLDALAKVVVDEINQVQRSGIDGYSQQGQDLLTISADVPHVAAALSLAVKDPLRVATASQFRVSEGAQNSDAVRANVTYTNADATSLVSNPGLVNNANAAAGIPVKIDSDEGYRFISDLAPGTVSPTIFLDHATGDQQLQIITADGRHIAGSTLNLDNQLLLINGKNNYPDGTQYSDKYLNQSGALGFGGLNVFYGIKAEVQSSQMFDANGNLLDGTTQPATLEGDRVLRPAGAYTIPAHAFQFNGVNWPSTALTIDHNDADIPQLIASSIDGVTEDVHAKAYNQVEFDSSALRYGKSLMLNNVEIKGIEGETNIAGVIARINYYTADTQVQAKLGDRGQVVLENVSTRGGQDIVVGSKPVGQYNAMGVVEQTYTGKVRITRDVGNPKDSALTLGMGTNGDVDMLTPLGLKLETVSPQVLLPHPAVLEGGRVPLPLQTQSFPTDGLTLNGIALPPLELTGLESDPVQALADWVNSAKAPDVTAVAYNEVQIDPKKVDLTQDLYVNGVQITGATDLPSLINKLADAHVGVRARMGERGQLIIENELAAQGKSISISGVAGGIGGVNALGIKSQDYTGMLRITRKISDPADSDIRLGFGKAGKPSLLSTLGFRTGAYIQGKVSDTLKVFVTGAGTASTVSASYSGEPVNMLNKLRAQSLSIRFTAADRYEIVDNKTGTQLAERVYEPDGKALTVHYQGLSVTLTSNPTKGDVFNIDGNDNGLGDNQNMMAMVDLSRQKVMSGKTLGDAYVDQVNVVGDFAQKAKITQDALKVINDQAVATRNKVSGVNLDEEAADLIRFQQAYQAAAKAMQISTELFSAIVQIR